MPVNLQAPIPSELKPVAGLRLGIAMAGVRKANRRDVLVVELAQGSQVAGVFTTNRFCAAPVQICREHLAVARADQPGIRALLVNTGNANAGTGDDGLQRARSTCLALACLLELDARQVLPFSTGVIMETLPIDRIEAALPAALADLDETHWATAAEAIMTTDTLPKAASLQVQIGGKTVTVTGIRGAIESAIADLKSTLETGDAEQVKDKTNALSQAAMKLGEAMYKAQQGQAASQSFGGRAARDSGEAEVPNVAPVVARRVNGAVDVYA